MHFHFIKYTKFWFLLSGLMLAVGIVAMVNNQIQTGQILDYGIDFQGGTLMEYRFEVPSADLLVSLKETINAVLPETVNQVTLTNENTYLVQARDLKEEDLMKIKEAVKAKHGNFELLSFTTIGPKIGSTLKRKAITAIIVASIAIVLYISYAFRHVPKRVSPWRFGLCAIIALLHDVLTVVGLFAFLNYEVDALFITALLTVMGFSVHDTIVVFDRIRENLKQQTRDDTFATIADQSLNQTLGRSINTSFSTLLPLLALYIFGAPSIKIFVLALIIGITVGTYSSIFIASPLLTWWQERSRTR